MRIVRRADDVDPIVPSRLFPGVKSRHISLSGNMSHASVPSELLAQRDLPCDLVRISVGIEDEEDLIADLDRAIHLPTQRTCIAIEPFRPQQFVEMP